MSYVVNWLGADGQAGWHPVADLLEAAAHVEHLRNEAGVHETKIFRLDEIAFEFKQYYRVELTDPAATVPAAADPVPESEGGSDHAPPVRGAGGAVDGSDFSDAADTAAASEMAEVAAYVGDSHAEADDAGSANGQRRGLFGR